MKLIVPFPPFDPKAEERRIKNLKKLVHSAFEELEEVLEEEWYKRIKQHKMCYPIEEMMYDVHSILEERDWLDDETIFWLRWEYRQTFYKYNIQHT